MMFFSTVVTQSKGSFRALTSMCHKTPHVYSFRSAATEIYCLAWLWLMNMFDFPFPGGCRSGLVPADPHPGESYSFGLGRQRSPGPSQDRVGKDCRVRCTGHTAHPFLQTGEDNTNLANSHDKWFFLLSRPPYRFFCVWCPQSVCEQDVRALVLVPTKELGQQVQTMIRQLTAYCSRDVRVADISGKADLSAQRSAHPDIV